MYEWLLVLHVLSAFALVAGFVAFWGLTLATRTGFSESMGSVAAPFGAVTGIGTIGTLVFGIWLAIYVDGYELWDGWILASLVLWTIGGWAGGRAGKEFERGPEGRQGWLRFQALNSLLILAILVLMIWKPGA